MPSIRLPLPQASDAQLAALAPFSSLEAYAWLPLPVWVYDPVEHCHAWANAAAAQLWACRDVNELLALQIPPLSQGVHNCMVQNMQRHLRGLSHSEPWTLYPKGVPTPLVLHSRGIRLPNGRQGLVLAGSATQPDGAHAQLMRGVEAIKHTSVRIALYDLSDGHQLMSNPAAALCLAPKPDIDGTSSDFERLFESPETAALISRHAAERREFQADLRLHTPQGLRWHSVDVRPVRDPVSGQRVMQLNARDISELKAAQAALEDARRAADDANAAKTAFLAHMSHEIRTPMNGVLGLTELVLHGELAPRQREFITMAHASARSLLALINDLLDIAKIESGQMTLACAPFSLRHGVTQAMEALHVEADRKGLTLTVDIHPDAHDKVLGDALRLRQILVNLVGNAIKFTHQGSVRVAVAPVAGEPGWMALSVQDSGIGIAAELLPHIYTPYKQASAHIGGTGLGLAIVKRLIDLMHGRIEVQSLPGEGTLFRVVLPLPASAG